jgi:capping protein beta
MSAPETPEEAARNLVRHCDPKNVEDRVFETIKLNRDVMDDVLAQVDTPLKVGTDSSGNQYILCDYNRDGDSYRSPFTNAFLPAIPKPQQLPDALREIEVMGNRGFASYLRQYFDSGVLSVYCWECDEDSFGVGVFIKKDITGPAGGPEQLTGTISCADVCEVKLINRKQRIYNYGLVSSAIVSITWKCRLGTPVTLAGSVIDGTMAEGGARGALDHLVTLGGIIEASCDRFVGKIRGIYVSRMREILSYMKVDAETSASQQKAQDYVAGGLKHELKIVFWTDREGMITNANSQHTERNLPHVRYPKDIHRHYLWKCENFAFAFCFASHLNIRS